MRRRIWSAESPERVGARSRQVRVIATFTVALAAAAANTGCMVMFGVAGAASDSARYRRNGPLVHEEVIEQQETPVGPMGPCELRAVLVDDDPGEVTISVGHYGMQRMLRSKKVRKTKEVMECSVDFGRALVVDLLFPITYPFALPKIFSNAAMKPSFHDCNYVTKESVTREFADEADVYRADPLVGVDVCFGFQSRPGSICSVISLSVSHRTSDQAA